MTNTELKDKFSRHVYLTQNTNPTYLLDQNVVEYSGTRPKKHFIPLSQRLSQDTLDEDVLDYAIKNNQTIVTNDREFVVQNLLKSQNVIFQNNYNTRYYFRVKESFVFDRVNQLPEIEQLDFFQKIKLTLLHKNTKPQYIESYEVSTYDHSRSNFLFVHARDILPKSVRRYSPRGQQKKVLAYAVKNNLTVITKSKHLCILSLLETNRCIFEDDYGVRYSVILHDAFEFEKVQLLKRECETSNTPKKDELEYNIQNMRDAIVYIVDNLHYVELQLRQRKVVESIRII